MITDIINAIGNVYTTSSFLHLLFADEFSWVDESNQRTTLPNATRNLLPNNEQKHHYHGKTEHVSRIERQSSSGSSSSALSLQNVKYQPGSSSNNPSKTAVINVDQSQKENNYSQNSELDFTAVNLRVSPRVGNSKPSSSHENEDGINHASNTESESVVVNL